MAERSLDPARRAAPAHRRSFLPRGANTAAIAAALLVLLALAALPPAAGLLDEPFLIRFFTRIMVMAIAAMSLDLILGFGGMVSLGHAAFVGIGAYAVGILSWHATNAEPLLSWPVAIQGTESAFVAWPAAVLAAALAALAIGLVSLRTSGVFFIMITLAFAQMLYFFFIALQKYGGEDGLQLMERSSLGPVDLGDRVTFYYVVLAVLACCLGFAARLVRSRFGMVLRGCRQNERRLLAIGIPTTRYKLAAFVIAGAMGGLAGVLLVNSQSFVSPADMAWTRSGEILVMVILGGMGTLVGPILGAAAYLLLELVIGSYTTHWQVIFGPALIAVVLFAKRGLYGLLVPGGAGRSGGGDG
ncbi:MAG TPA: branched-chain amino acid ABC transporter permease [Stellaceae bacterium]|jgi:branched-chain amino acid transport system permease protein